MTVQEWLGTDNKIGVDIWEKKYRYKNESFDNWLDRVSNGNEKSKAFDCRKEICFGGRVLSNRGTSNNASYFQLLYCWELR